MATCRRPTARRTRRPEFFVKAHAATTAVGESHAITIVDNVMGTYAPSFNGSDPRYPDYDSFGQGSLVTRTGMVDLTATQSAMFGGATGIAFQGGAMRDVDIHGNAFEGFSTGIILNPGVSYTDFHVHENKFFNLSNDAFELNSAGINDIDFDANDCDLDPYLRQPYRATANQGLPGGWIYDNVNVCVRVDQGFGIKAERNTIKNASDDIDVDTTNPTGGIYWANNIAYADLHTNYPNTAASGFNLFNLGVGNIHPGSKVIEINGDPTKANFGTIYSVPVSAAAAAPVSGFWGPGDYVRNTAQVAATPTAPTIAGWSRVSLGPRNLLGFDWQPDYLGAAAPPLATLVQSASVRNPDSGTSATIAFANPVQAADTVLMMLVGGGGANATFAPTVPAGCTEIAGPTIAGYSAAASQDYEVWQCSSGLTYTVSGLDDGAILQGMEVANYQSALVSAAPLAQNGAALTVPVTGGTGDLRLGVVEWNGAGTTVTTSPSSIATTDYPAGSDSYHYGFAYAVPAGTTGTSYTATTGYTVADPTYLQLDLQSRSPNNLQTGNYTLTSSDCGTKVLDTGATAPHTYTMPFGICQGLKVTLVQETANKLTLTNGAGEIVNYITSAGTVTSGTAAAGSLSVSPIGQFGTLVVGQESPSTATLTDRGQ